MPSPLTFKIMQPSGPPLEVNGYCNKRRDSLAMRKAEDGNGWEVIHKASGNSVSSAISSSVTGYPKTLALMAHVQENAAQSLAILDRMTIGEKVVSPEQQAAASDVWSWIQSFKG